MHNNYDDLEYQGITDVKPTYYCSIIATYYNPELIESSFNHNYERYQINGDKNKELSINDYFNTITENLINLINIKKVSEKKVQLIISTVFLNYLNDETAIKYTYSDNVEIRSTDDSKRIVTELFNSLLHRYQETLENKMEGSRFVFDYVNFLDIKFNPVHLIRGRSCIPSPNQIKSEKATINPKNDDNECFKYAIAVALNHTEISNHLERISNVKKQTHKYNWNNINFPSQRKGLEQFEKDNDIALNILSVRRNGETIELQYKSKHNKTSTNQVVLLTITDDNKWYYLALKSILTSDGKVKPTQCISRLFNKIT